MSCVDFMYQFYSPYFPYKSPSDDSQKYATQPLYDTGIPGPGPSNFLESPGHAHTGSHAHHSHPHHPHPHTASDKDTPGVTPADKSGSQPKATHYLASNCVLLTYFQGETASLVDEHFSRSLGQPSSFTLDKPAPNNKPYVRSDTALMCHRKFPPSFWNASYQAPCSIPNGNHNSSNSSSSGSNSNNFSFGADAYFQSSLYNFHKTWPYHYGSQSHTYPHTQSSLSYPTMDPSARLSSHYGSLIMPGASLTGRVGGESRHHPHHPHHPHHSQYDHLAKSSSDAFSNYYPMGRFGGEVEATLPGLDLPLQQAKKEHYW